MPPAVTGGFSNHLAPGLEAIIGTNLEGRESFYSRYYNVKTSNRNYEDVLAAAGLPIASSKPQGQPITAVDPLEGTTQRVTFPTWGIGMEVSEEAWDDDLYANDGSALRDGANGIADSLAERVEVEAHRPLNAEGFDGSTYTVLPDSSGLFATSHSPVTGGEAAAQANRPSTDADISVTTYRAALITIRKYVNDRGLRIPGFCTAARLILPPDNTFDAQEIVQSKMRPDTMNQVDNVSPGIEILPQGNPYITDTDQWIIQCRMHYLNFYWRWRPRLDSFDDRRSRVAIFVGYERFNVIARHWLGLYGSSG